MIFKNSIILGIFSVLSVLFGILRDRLLAQYVGVGAVLDIYNASFRIPDLALGVMLSFATGATVIPFITKSIHTNNKKDLEERFGSLFIFFGLMMILISLFVIIFLPFFAKFIVPGFNQTQLIYFIFYTRILMIQPILLGLSSLVSTLAQARHQFFLYGVAPLLYSSGIILSILIGYKKYGLTAIIFGVIFGALAHLLFQSITLYHHDIKIRLSHFKWTLIKEQLHLSIPRSGSFLVSQLRVIFFTAFATTLGPGILSIYVFAQRIIDASIQVIPQSISTASLPTLSSQYALNDFIAYKSTFKRNILSIFLVSLVLTLVFIFASNLVVYILYGNISHNNEIATMLRWFAIGLPIYAINTYISIALSSLRDTKSLLYANGIATIIAVLLFFVLKNYNFGVYSLIFSSLIVTPVFLITILLLYRGKKDIFV